MQQRVVAIGGLENAYMRKLALYLSDKMEGQARVAVVGGPEIEKEKDAQAVWVGSRAFIEEVQRKRGQADCIVLTEEPEEDGMSVCRYQSGEKLYQKIILMSSHMRALPETAVNPAQRWIVMTTDSAVSQMLAFALTAAGILVRSERVLFLNLTACSGMRPLLQMEDGADFSDLILAVRAGERECLAAYVREVERTDCIFPPENPSVLYEVTAADMERLVEMIGKEQRYSCVLVALGTAVNGCEMILRRAGKVLHLTREEECFSGCTEEWLRFLGLCGVEETSVVRVKLPQSRARENGIHLLYEWQEGLLGQVAEMYVGMGNS